jgi:C4-dicarboxylate-specific signal transduction histidine kinase
MASIFHRRPSLERAIRVALISLFGLLTTAFSAPIEDLRQEIRTLKMEQATVTQREEAVMARQDELTSTIKRLKSETRGPAGPFGSRKLEAALKPRGIGRARITPTTTH